MKNSALAIARAPLALAILWLAIQPVAAAERDGPYVVPDPDGNLHALSVAVSADGPARHSERVSIGGKLTVPAVGGVPAFAITLRPPAADAPDKVALRASAPLFVVADTHGEFEILVGLLQKHGVIDPALEWRFGRGHLVVLGDVFDRGPNQTEILWLLYQLDGAARKAGGGVHLVLGNHEVMVMQGDLRYLNPKYAQSAQLLGAPSYAQLFGPTSVLGQWLRTRPAVLEIGGLLCTHGGISPALVGRGLALADINAVMRALLGGTADARSADRALAALLLQEQGPLWYRGYFPDRGAAAATAADVDAALAHFAVRGIVVGHTRVPATTSLYGRKVIAIHVYPTRETNGSVSFEGLLVRGGKFLRALPDGTTQPLN